MNTRQKITPAQLAKEVQHLRVIFREALESYRVRIEGELSKSVDSLEKLDKKSIKDQLPLPLPVRRELKTIKSSIQKLRVKPRKGRRRDLRVIEKLADDFFDRLHQW
jgi:hypothetical protein